MIPTDLPLQLMQSESVYQHNKTNPIRFPLYSQVQQGEITVRIELSTQIMSSVMEVPIRILPEGSIVHRHTSVLLDLKSRANVLNFMNIIVDETPIIPYEVSQPRRLFC